MSGNVSNHVWVTDPTNTRGGYWERSGGDVSGNTNTYLKSDDTKEIDRYITFAQSATTPTDNDVIWTSNDLTGYAVHTFKVTAGSISVQADILGDGTFTSDLAMRDLAAVASGTFVLVSGAGTVQVVGNYKALRVLADGVATVASTSSHTNGEAHG